MKFHIIRVAGAFLGNVFSDLRQNKLRNVLCAISMFLGVLAVVLCSAVGDGVVDMVVAYEEQTSARALTYSATVKVPPASYETVAPALQSELEKRVRPDSVRVLVSVNASVLMQLPSDASNRIPGTGWNVEWDGADLSAIRRVAVLSGKFPSYENVFPPQLAVNEAAAGVIGYPGNSLMYLATDADGNNALFSVAGVVADGDSNPRAYGALAAFTALFGQAGTASTDLDIRFTVAGVNERYVDQVLSDLVADFQLELLVGLRRIDTAWSVVDQVNVLTAVFSSVAIFLLVVAAIGILNVGLSSVNERAQELVVRRAVGARRIDIFMLMLGAAIVESILVLLIAIGVALVCVYVVLPAFISPEYAIVLPDFPQTACVLGVLAALGTAIAGAAFPAWKASRLPVANALRE